MGVAAPGIVIAGRYRVDRLLGQGGMGSVWAATHLVTHKAVALKLLEDPGRLSTRRRFEREARAASAVAHPNIVAIHDVFETDEGMPVMVMDLLVGEPLDYRLVREGHLPLAEAARILLPVVSAVGSVHAHGIIHRDLKPANIFLADEGGRVVVKVLDFGLAKLTGLERVIRDGSALTSTGAMMGTPFYMAPEQCMGERELDHKVDVWALGVILYECLSGQRPITADNLGQVIKKVLLEGIPPLEDRTPGLPDEIYALVRRMLARERKDRPDDLREVSAVLERYTEGAPRVPSFGPPAPADPDTTPDPPVLHDLRRVATSRPLVDSRAETTFQTGSGDRLPAAEEPAPASVRVQRGLLSVAAAAAAVVAVALFLDHAAKPRPTTAPDDAARAAAAAAAAAKPLATTEAFASTNAPPPPPPPPTAAPADPASVSPAPSAAPPPAPPPTAVRASSTPSGPKAKAPPVPAVPAPPAATPGPSEPPLAPPTVEPAPTAAGKRGVIRDPRF